MSPIQVELRELRERAGLSQSKLSDKAGVRQAAISHIESGRVKRVDLDVLDRLCRALKTTPGELLTLSNRARAGSRR